MTEASTPDVTECLQRWGEGDQSVADELFPLVYSELRRLAGSRLRDERVGHTLQPTALVHEAYLRLIDQHSPDWHGRSHFFAIAARIMRRVLVDHARRRLAAKRGGDAARVTLEDPMAAEGHPPTEILALEEALGRLETMDPRQARVVELRFFAGFSVEETAAALEVSEPTVKRDWRVARAWLRRELDGDVAGG